ncbi:MAG: oligosaccharide flippase family protein [Caldilineales bacterium]|nr:oligosaccharide flippase family protein [Caldilineales bacterium]
MNVWPERSLWRTVRLRAAGRFVHHVLTTFGTQWLVLGLALVNAAVVARELGPAGKGTVTLATLVTTSLVLFLGGGLNLANAYYAGSGRVEIPRLTANAVAVALLVNGLAAVLVTGFFLTGWWQRLLPGMPAEILLLALAWFPALLLREYVLGILQGRRRIPTVNLINLTQTLLTLVGTVGFVVGLGWGLVGAMLAVVLAGWMALGLSLGLAQREGARWRPLWNRALLRMTLSYGLRGWLANILQFFNYRLDTFLLNGFVGAAVVGLYSVAVALAEMLWYLPNAVGFVLFPRAAATAAAAMNRFTPRVLAATMALTALAAVALAVFGRPLIVLVFSARFAAAYAALLALLPGAVLMGGAKVLANDIAGRGFPQHNSLAAGVGLIVTVVGDLLLIPRYGAMGAGLASSAAYAVVFGLTLSLYRRVSRRSAETVTDPS